MKFDIHISKNFGGGIYFCSFSAFTADEALSSSLDAWDKSGLHADSGEAFIFVNVIHAKQASKIELGTFKYYEDGEIFFEAKDNRFFEETEFFANDYIEPKDALIACLAHVMRHGTSDI